MAKIVVHALIVIALIAAYTVLSVTGNDANALLTILVGYLGGATVEGVANKRANPKP